MLHAILCDLMTVRTVLSQKKQYTYLLTYFNTEPKIVKTFKTKLSNPNQIR